MRWAFIGTCTWLAVACSAPNANIASPADAPASSEIRLYDRETFTVVMTHSGAVTGTTTTHVRNWGRQQAILNDTTLSVGDTTQQTRNRIVIDGPRIITINAGGAATGMTIPDYDQRVDRLGLSPMEYREYLMTLIGARRTGESGAFAGHQCEYWEIPSIGCRSCVTAWGLHLYISNTMANVTQERATKVLIGDGGPDSAFSYDSSGVVESPNPLPDDPRFPERRCELDETTRVLTCSSVEPPRCN